MRGFSAEWKHAQSLCLSVFLSNSRNKAAMTDLPSPKPVEWKLATFESVIDSSFLWFLLQRLHWNFSRPGHDCSHSPHHHALGKNPHRCEHFLYAATQ